MNTPQHTVGLSVALEVYLFKYVRLKKVTDLLTYLLTRSLNH